MGGGFLFSSSPLSAIGFDYCPIRFLSLVFPPVQGASLEPGVFYVPMRRMAPWLAWAAFLFSRFAKDMCGFRLILFSSRVTCSLLREACKSFPFNHGIQDSSQAVPRCLRFSITPAWNSTSPCKPESLFEPRKIFFLVLKL